MERADVGAFRVDKIQDDDFFTKIVEFDDLDRGHRARRNPATFCLLD